MLEKIVMFFLIFFIYSMLGWVMEVINSLIREKKFINRGFLIGPYCPIYGLGIILISILLQKYQDDFFVTYIFSIIICGILEYFTSYVLEKIFGARWWDYSNRRFNINGRICLENLFVFGILACYIVYISNPIIISLLQKVHIVILIIISILIFIGLVIDITLSTNIIFNLKILDLNVKKDYTEEISLKVRNIIKRRLVLHRRVLKAFPNIRKRVDLDEIVTELKNRIENLKNKIEK